MEPTNPKMDRVIKDFPPPPFYPLAYSVIYKSKKKCRLKAELKDYKGPFYKRRVSIKTGRIRLNNSNNVYIQV